MTAAEQDTLQPPPEHERVAVVDRFPMTVVTPDGTEHRGCRVILTRPTPDHSPWAWIWRDVRPTPELLYSAPWLFEGTTLTDRSAARREWTLATPDGTATLTPGAGCGCSSPLKRMQPWAPMRRGQL